MLIYEYKLQVTPAQRTAIDEAIRVVHFIRNTCLRVWMDERGIGANDLQIACGRLAYECAFAARLNPDHLHRTVLQEWIEQADRI